MAGCDICGVSMQSPCGIICLADCSICWCTVVEAKLVDSPVGFAQIKLKPGPDVTVNANTQLKICNTDQTLSQLAVLFNHLRPEAPVEAPATATESRPSGMHTGTLDQLIQQLGLVPAPRGASAS